jgi:hypothetical protein
MTKMRRDLVSKGALAMVVALGIACRGEGVAENTGVVPQWRSRLRR